jgi:hypothetical protein
MKTNLYPEKDEFFNRSRTTKADRAIKRAGIKIFKNFDERVRN